MLLIEVSSEAGRKIGGIYTVLRSKAPYVNKKLKGKYFLIGMHDELCNVDVEYQKTPKQLEKFVDELEKDYYITTKFANWIYADNVNLILIEFKRLFEKKIRIDNHEDLFINHFKFQLWEKFGVDSLNDRSWDFSENVLFGLATGLTIKKFLPFFKSLDEQIICHFHEWITASGLLYLKIYEPSIRSVFTTHATVLGRTLSSYGRDVFSEAMDYSENKIRNDSLIREAYKFNVESKHLIETAAAHNASVFTTVSETTSYECDYILGKKADVITINGIDAEIKKMQSSLTNQKLKEYNKQELLQFIDALFSPYYEINLKDIKTIYISGRYEFTNKGYDIFIDSIAELDRRLRNHNSNVNVFAFIFAPSGISKPRDEIIHNYLLIDKVSEVLENIGVSKIYDVYGSTLNAVRTIQDKEIRKHLLDMLSELKKSFDNNGNPILLTHYLQYGNDPIIERCIKNNLINSKENRVKVIFYPTYLNPKDNLLANNYYSVISSFDIGMFPSRYEPFGYTPLEAALMGNIAITSSNTGFGRYVRHYLKDCENISHGIIVIDILNKSHEQIVSNYAQILEELVALDKNQLDKLKKDSETLAKMFDWEKVIANYFKAYEIALEK
ncbi:MAG: glycogen/starch synthase [Candidatus Micrarchaeota archaeon]|nr:glycogen/starch synthase [Candidatus Micrarchaeota archaeon]